MVNSKHKLDGLSSELIGKRILDVIGQTPAVHVSSRVCRLVFTRALTRTTMGERRV